MRNNSQDYTVIQKGEEGQRQSPKYSYFSHSASQDESIRKIVLQTVTEQMPFIIAQVKDAVLKDLQRNPDHASVASQVSSNIEKEVLQKIEKVEIIEVPKVEDKPARVEEERKLSDEKKDNFHNSEVEVNFVNPNVEQQVYVQHQEQFQQQQQPQRQEKPGIFDHLKKIGDNIKRNIAGIPEVFSSKNEKIENDPIVEIEEGRYPKSAVEKVANLQDFFPEASKKELLDFIIRFPSYATLEQLADAYLRKDEYQPPVVVDNNNNQPNPNPNIV